MSIKFNPDNKSELSYKECLGPAMYITDQSDADQYLAAYIAYLEPRTDGYGVMTAEQIAKINLGYYAGYWGPATRERVECLFKCSHPVFGSIEKNGAPTPEEAYQKGYENGVELEFQSFVDKDKNKG